MPSRLVRCAWAACLALLIMVSLCSEPTCAAEQPSPLPANAVLRLATVQRVAFSPDGRTLALAGADHAIQLRDSATGKELRRLEGHQTAVLSLAFAGDGTALVSGGEDGTVRVWEVEKGRERHRLASHRGDVFSVAFAPDGQTVASAGKDGTVRIWDLSTGKERKLASHKGEIRSVAYAPDGRTLASAGRDRLVRVWDPSTDKELRTLRGHGGWVLCVTFSADGKLLVSAGRDQVIYIREAATGKPLYQLAGYQGEVFSIALSSDGRTVASGGRDSIVRLWEVATGQERRRLTGHTDSVRCVAFSPDGKTVASASDDGTVLLRDITGHHTRGETGPRASPSGDRKALWADLASMDAPRAYQAMWDLAATSAETVPFIKDHLRPVAADQIEQLIADLDDKQFTVRERASQELAALGTVAQPALQRAASSSTSLEVCRRARHALANLEGQNIPPDLLRVLRAIEVLEWIGTREARLVLKTLAKGPAETEAVRLAKAALERLTAKSK